MGLLMLTSFSFGDDLQAPIPPASSDILGPPLITWTEQQRPGPLPDATQPRGETDKLAAAGPSQQQFVWQSFTGIVVKIQAGYFLKVADDRLYRLDDGESVNPLEGKRVKLAGWIGEDGQGIRVMSIEGIW